MPKIIMLSFIFLTFSAGSLATTTSNPDANPIHVGFVSSGDRSEILLLDTFDSVVKRVLDELELSYDFLHGADFSGLDLTGYEQVFLAMDGGLVEEPSIANLASYVNDGGRLHIYGGSNYYGDAMALNQHLLANEVTNHYWSMSPPPHVTIVDVGHCLATGLPSTYNFIHPSASYYQTRSLDTSAVVIAVNGDGYDMLMQKTVGQGLLNICINSSWNFYYGESADYAWAKQLVINMLICDAPVATEPSTWGSVKAMFHDVTRSGRVIWDGGRRTPYYLFARTCESTDPAKEGHY